MTGGNYQKYYEKMYKNKAEVQTMKFFVTGVNGQLGHDVMNEIQKINYEGIESDLAEQYAVVANDSAVTTMPDVSLDITVREAVINGIRKIQHDAVNYCVMWTTEDDDKVEKVHAVNACVTKDIADVCKAVAS